MTAPRPDDTPVRFPRQAPPVDMALRRANVLAQLDSERQRHPERFRPQMDPTDWVERRFEAIEAALAQLSARLDEITT